MRFHFVLSLLLLTQPLFADNSDQDTLRLLEAKNVAEVAQTSEHSMQLRVAKAACEAQHRVKQVPTNCFETLTLELHSGILDRARAEVIENGLLASCDERAMSQTSIEILDAALKTKYLPKRCRTAVEKRRRELLYIMMSSTGNVVRELNSSGT